MAYGKCLYFLNFAVSLKLFCFFKKSKITKKKFLASILGQRTKINPPQKHPIIPTAQKNKAQLGPGSLSGLST